MPAFNFPKFLALILVLAAFLWPPAPAVAQEPGDPIVMGTWQRVESEVLGETRLLKVALPDGYEEGADRYPVLYVLDGQIHFRHTAGIVEFLSRTDRIPKMIVVAIPSTKRVRDMTPPSRGSEPLDLAGGGVANFMRFFSEELIPYIDSTYRTYDHRVVFGHSLGGLFAVHALVHQPDLFDGYIAVSPSLQWDEQMLVSQSDTFFEAQEDLKKSLYMTTGNEGGGLTGGVMKLAGILTEHTPDDFEWDWRVMPEESHRTVVHRSIRQGLEFVFQHWSVRDAVDLYTKGGTEGIHAYYEQAEERYGIPRTAPQPVVNQLAMQLVTTGHLEEARDVLDHDPDNYPPHPLVYATLGRAYLDGGDREHAIETLGRALELSPADPDIKKALTGLGVDLSDMEFDVPVEVLRTYIGTYADENSEVEVELVDGRLRATGSRIPTLDLMPLSEHHFAAERPAVRVIFSHAADGSVAGFSIELSGRTLGEYERQR